MCTITINLFRWNQIEIYYMLFVLFRWNQIDICMGIKKKKTIYTHDQWGMKKIHFEKYKGWKKFILWNIRDYELDFVKFDLVILLLKNDHVKGTW